MIQIATDGYISSRLQKTLLMATNGYIPFGKPGPYVADVALSAFRETSSTLLAYVETSASLSAGRETSVGLEAIA